MKVIDAMLSKLKSPSLLMSFSKLMDAVSDCFVTSFSQAQISALVRMQLADFAEWQIQSYTATGTSGSSTHCYSAPGAEAVHHEAGRKLGERSPCPGSLGTGRTAVGRQFQQLCCTAP